MNIDKLKDLLDSKKFDENLVLNDMLIGDEGCHAITEFLKDYSDFQLIELKGNNISPRGLEILSEGIINCKYLEGLILEWNNIG